MSRLKNESVLITGGASGLGLAIVERFLDEGASVTVMDKSEKATSALTQKIKEKGFADKLLAVNGDVRNYQDNENAVASCVAKFGKLDCIIGNAGIWDFSKSLVDLPVEQLDQSFDDLFHINVKGYLYLAKAALEPLARSGGSMIFTVSNAGFYPDGGGPLYTATKHAVVGLIRQFAFELAPHIRVNGVAPGAIDTNLRGSEALGQDEKVIPGKMLGQAIPNLVPVGVMPKPKDYAGAYVFFASREDNIPSTGVILNHDGGLSARGFTKNRGGDKLLSQLNIEV
ncbi:MAG: 3-(cis-5,6-dihydroxycyclohexa-1,3-dien-1-yl)propanoate dehydrogenase [Pseudomonadales bacterium]|nr:3-(cis-5,6-dihydroxycyclohexa-1,3-dien-1-yl)propanoate dehydrogenase [Pseudomonadales bacterium]